ncbi:SAYSvFN domain-containing protein 1-like [Corticium candelabrum]|uniref:SAYSvFN domain-containing protein 1-like n=1 Tax=Corticium candelabrum TaxID=121492 RepID=UPI002E25B28B|nr:SAYSvFN domain-containing protein 1-like [Corticium candelabrum]
MSEGDVRQGNTNRGDDGIWNIIGSAYLWKAVVWLCLWGFFVEIEFGTVFFIASILLVVYCTLGSEERKAGEMSAYSVFNEGFKAIDGTLTAEQFDREIRSGPGRVGTSKSD